MARDIVIGNGKTLVCLDEFGFVRDFYYPYVGQENHVLGKKHRIGISVNGVFSWLDDGSWKISGGYMPDSNAGNFVYESEHLNVSLVIENVVYNEANTFLRKIEIYNKGDVEAEIKLFLSQVFSISENTKRNTAFYDPTHNSVVHYRGRRVFIVNGRTEKGEGIDQYTMGAFEYKGKVGSYLDAEDGELSMNAVEHGSVDSVIRFRTCCGGATKQTMYYWICAGKSLDDAYAANRMVMEKTPEGMIHSTKSFWKTWLKNQNYHLGNLTDNQAKLFKTSLLVIRNHMDDRGSMIASADSKMMEYGKDDYTYLWPRDASFVANTMDKAGFADTTKSFYRFCKEVLHEDGYLFHRYRPDGSLGSTWHSPAAQKRWLENKTLQLPIQEDESASVLYSLWQHYLVTKNIEFIEELYQPLIEKISHFLVGFRYPDLGLPLPSYDLWEEKIGVSTYTCAAVYGGLMAAADFAELLDKRSHMREFRQVAQEIKEAAIKHLYNKELNSFVRIGFVEDGVVLQNEVCDSSTVFGLWYYKMLKEDDPLYVSTVEHTLRNLHNPGQAGGIIRYSGDSYFRDGSLSNPWIITTLWEALRRLNKSNVEQEDLDYTKTVFDWVEKHSLNSGMMPEQLDPNTGYAKSATPLAWSHATYVDTVMKYIAVLESKGLCKDCEPAGIAQL